MNGRLPLLAAVRQWRRMISPDTARSERVAIKSDLLAYCDKDTELMHRILDGFRLLVSVRN